MDDIEVIGLNHSAPFSQSLLTPHGNDHTIPLFTAEMEILDILFGQNEAAYNIFVFILFALIPFFTYLTLARLGVKLSSFFIFLILFSGATGWAEMLTGFYIMSIYLQIILFFTITMWAYTAWGQTSQKKYLTFFVVSLLFALAADTSGVWIIPATLIFIMHSYWSQSDSFKIRRVDIMKFLKTNRAPLLLLLGASTLFVIFLTITFMILQPNTFLSALSDTGTSTTGSKEVLWRFFPLVENFLAFFSSGVSLSLFAPNIVKILVHPSIQGHVKSFWYIIEAIILVLNAGLFWFTLKYSQNKEKKLFILLGLIMFITISMVVVARPNHEIIPDFDYRYAGAPYYLYCLLIAVGASHFLEIGGRKSLRIIVSIVIILFATQQAFSFQAVRTRTESVLRKEAVTRLDRTLLSELATLSKNSSSLVIPNLSGTHIFEQTMSGFTLADYLLFFDKKTPIKLVRNAEMPPDVKTRSVMTVPSIRSVVSKDFLSELSASSVVRSYYATSGILSYKILPPLVDEAENKLKIDSGRKILIYQRNIDPEKLHVVDITLYTDNVHGNLELSFYFKNDFDASNELGKIRIDDYTPYVLKGDKRYYHIEVDLLQIYTYALSEKISGLSLYVPEVKSPTVNAIYLR
ncbi:MAG: hypothetical protein Q7K40_02365 [bacterium]|nr:hypothetical protein [bacterium]